MKNTSAINSKIFFKGVLLLSTPLKKNRTKLITFLKFFLKVQQLPKEVGLQE